jgi:hypothetical protein
VEPGLAGRKVNSEFISTKNNLRVNSRGLGIEFHLYGGGREFEIGGKRR